jgi:hypothetical protein
MKTLELVDHARAPDSGRDGDEGRVIDLMPGLGAKDVDRELRLGDRGRPALDPEGRPLRLSTLIGQGRVVRALEVAIEAAKGAEQAARSRAAAGRGRLGEDHACAGSGQ